MLKINEVIIVEGRYDKIKLDQIIDGVVITTDGFALYKNKEKKEFIKRVAREKGVIVLTDSDYAGMRIRNYIKNIVGNVEIKNAYIPQVEGKERRKEKAGKQGLLGVEGMKDEIIIDAIKKAGVTPPLDKEKLTKSFLFEVGLSGGEGSFEKRKKLARELQLPVNISANALLDYINLLYTKEEVIDLLKKLNS